MIGVNGQFLLVFGLNSLSGFIRLEDFRSFYVKEEAGNNLPSFKLSFDCDTAILGMLNESSNLAISMGSSMNDLVTTTLYITEMETGRIGDRRRVVCQGMLATPGYLQNRRTGITSKKSGVEVVKDVASRYFNFDTNINQSSDKQNWIQNNLPDKQFLSNAWLRSDLPGSYPAVAVSALNNTFILRDVKKLTSSNPIWYFQPTDEGAGGNVIPYHGDYSVKNMSGFVNSWAGYERKQAVFNIDKGLADMIGGLAENFMAGASSLMQRGASGGIDAIGKSLFTVATANMHANYHQAHANNMRQLAIASSFKVSLGYTKIFAPIRVLDTAFFMEDSTATSGAAEYASGDYLVSKVERFFTAYQHGTKVELTREGPGGR